MERSDVANEIARQLVTTIGIVIVAIAAFYFGAKTLGEGDQVTDQVTRES